MEGENNPPERVNMRGNGTRCCCPSPHSQADASCMVGTWCAPITWLTVKLIRTHLNNKISG